MTAYYPARDGYPSMSEDEAKLVLASAPSVIPAAGCSENWREDRRFNDPRPSHHLTQWPEQFLLMAGPPATSIA
jgi:hypothetical protein